MSGVECGRRASAPAQRKTSRAAEHGRRARRASLVGLIVLAGTTGGPIVLAETTVALAEASGAQANTYVINDCPSAPIPTDDAGPWTVWGAPQTAKGSCGGGFGDYLAPRGAVMGPNTADGVEVTVPAGSGITIREARVWWAVPKQIAGADDFAVAETNSGVVYNTLTPFEGANDFVLPSTTTSFYLEDYCSSDHESQGCEFGEAQHVDLQLFGAQLTLADSRLPTGSVTGGGLAGAGAISGAQSLAYAAEDQDSGVRSAQLLVDGQTAAQIDYVLKCPYTGFAACPNAESGALTWNSASVTNGIHEIALRVVDAAGNTATIDDHTITVDNQPIQTDSETIGGALGGMGAPNGEPCAGETLELTVDGRRTPPPIPYRKPATIRGTLHCGAVPVRQGQIAIATVGGSPSVALTGTVQTGPDGSFTYQVPAGPDRVLRFSYTAYGNDPGPSATATVALSSLPKIALRIGPRRVGNGHAIHWSGTIVGGPYPPGGVTLDVEVKEGRRWKVFDQAVTDGRGRFHYSYRFHATTEPTTYTFRVALPATGASDYPYAPGASNTIPVHVSP